MLSETRHAHDDVIKHFRVLALCEGNPPVTGGFPSQIPVTRSFDTFFDRRWNKRLSKQSRRRCFETSSRWLWRHCNATARIDTAAPGPSAVVNIPKLKNHNVLLLMTTKPILDWVLLLLLCGCLLLFIFKFWKDTNNSWMKNYFRVRPCRRIVRTLGTLCLALASYECQTPRNLLISLVLCPSHNHATGSLLSP